MTMARPAKRLSIALVTAYDTRASGGLSTFVQLYAQGLRAQGHAVTVIDEREIPAWKRAVAFWLVRNPLYVLKRDWGMRAYFSLVKRMLRSRVAQEARRRRIDAVHAQDVLAANAVGEIPALKGAPLLLTVHGDLTNMCLSDKVVTPGGPGERRARREEAAGYDIADRIVAVDGRLKAHVEAFSHRGDVRAIRNFVDVRRFSPPSAQAMRALRRERGVPDDAFVVFCPRRLVEKNGVAHAARAAVAAHRKDARVMLVVAGDGPERAAIERAIRDEAAKGGRQGAPCVRLLGDVAHADILAWYALCDAVAIPSVTSQGVIEATSISALEGMACGKPVIASGIGGLAELIESGKTGVLVPEGDERAIERAMLALAKDPAQRVRLGTAARAFVERHHSVESQAALYLAQLEDVAANPPMRVLFVNTYGEAHYAYLELMRDPPEGMRFLNANEYATGHLSASMRKGAPGAGGGALQAIKRALGRLPIPTMARVGERKGARADILYCSQAIPLTPLPWAIDTEMAVALARFHQRTFDRPMFRRILSRSLASPRCVALTAWTGKAARGAIAAGAPRAKVRVVMPSVRPDPRMSAQRPRRKGTRLLFVGADFERKGGAELLLAFGKVHEAVPGARLRMVTSVPERYAGLARQPGVEIVGSAPREDLYATHYPWADVFVSATYQDTYGLALIEAMAFGLPVVATRVFGMEEIVAHGRTGLLLAQAPPSGFARDGLFEKGYEDIYTTIDAFARERPEERERLVDQLAQACIALLTDDAKRLRMGALAQEEALRGRLSHARRREEFAKAMGMTPWARKK